MGKKILITDDSQIFLISVGLFLRKLGYTVIPAESGSELLKMARLQEPHLIIFDVKMKSCDGIGILKQLKEDKHTSRIPVIILSTDSATKTIEECKCLGSAAYLFKPVKIDGLHAAIQSCFYSHIGTNRKHLRVSVNKKVRVTCDDKNFELFCENLSVGGIYLRKRDPFPIGSNLRIAFPIEGAPSVELEGTVIYTRELFGDLFKLPPGMAVEFRGLSKEDYVTLKNYIEQLMTGDIIEGPGDFSLA